jgi:hypothetical protein
MTLDSIQQLLGMINKKLSVESENYKIEYKTMLLYISESIEKLKQSLK